MSLKGRFKGLLGKLRGRKAGDDYSDENLDLTNTQIRIEPNLVKGAKKSSLEEKTVVDNTVVAATPPAPEAPAEPAYTPPPEVPTQSHSQDLPSVEERESMGERLRASLEAAGDRVHYVLRKLASIVGTLPLMLKALIKRDGAESAQLRDRIKGLAQQFERIPPMAVVVERMKRSRWAIFLIAGFVVADLAMQGLGFYLLNDRTPPPPRPVRYKTEKPYLQSKATYDAIIRKNAFCPGCPIPEVEMRTPVRIRDCALAKQQPNPGFNLLGTIVLSKPEFSVATFSQGSGETIAVQKGDAFGNIGSVFEIRRGRVCFETPEGNLTYVEMELDQELSVGNNLPAGLRPSKMDGISRTSETEIAIRRDFLIEKLNDPNLLFQAQAIVHRDTPDGPVTGFKILSIVPGSVYESLGLQPNDIMRGVNGEPLDSLAKAQELYASIRNVDEVKMEITRNGSPVTLTFKVQK